MAESSSEDEIKPAAGAGSAEERCPICLEDYEDKAFIDACFHAFCFGCIVKAVEMTTGRCPMCKTTFDTVIHNVRAIDDYDRFKIQPKPTPPPPASLSIMQEEAFQTFRGYRTTRLPGQPSSRESAASTSIDHTRQTATAVAGTSSQGLLPVASKTTHSRKKASTQSIRQPRKPAALERRRAVYSTGLRALPIENSDSRRIRVRDIAASFFRSNPASTHRLFPWLTREFKVLVGDEHVEFMLQLMQSLIDKIDMENAEFGNHLEPFLHEKTQHFMHELISFAKSPYDMIAYDNKVRYDWPETHPQAQGQLSGGDAKEITDTAGPSGIQQRVLEELMMSRWDNSPPLHSGSQSPTIVIQDSSDSEPDLYSGRTPSPSPHSELPTEGTRETVVEQTEEPAQLATPSAGSSNTQRDVQSPNNVQTESQQQLMLTRTSTETAAGEEHEQSTSMLEGTSDEHLASLEPMFESCPEVSSSAALVEKPVTLNNEVSSTSERLEPISLLSSSAGMASQPCPEIVPHEEATTLQSHDQVQDPDDDDFEISLYAEDGGTSLGDGSTPTSDILKRSRNDRDKSSRVSKLKKKSHKNASDLKEKERKSKSKHSESKSSSHESSSRRQKSEKDREQYHRQIESHRRRSRSRSHSKSRSYRSRRHDSTDREYSSRSRHRSREREYSHKRKSHRSRSRSVSRSRYSHSCSSDDDTSARIKSTVVAKLENKRDKDERERRHRHERQRRERSESRSPHRRISSHYRGEHDYDRRSSNYDKEHRSRGRLYSDDHGWSEELHSPHSSSSKSMRHSTASSHSSQRKVSQRTVKLSLSDEEKQNPNETKLLAQELSQVDKQIQDNKKELLKSMLRKERLELLQKSLHGGESGEDSLFASSVLQKPSDAASTRTTGEMEKELELLNRAITDGKKQLLKVMKKVEEEQVEMNQD